MKSILVLSLVSFSAVASTGKLSLDAREKLAALENPTLEEIANLRETSELTIQEILEDMPDLRSPNPVRSSRPSLPPVGALYMDVYQESPVLIDYVGDGDVVQEMSFAVVYKYIQDAQGNVVPHFVRAHLVSPGTSGHRTSVGEFSIDRRHRRYVSQTYGSRMDFAQFFIGGIAIHETPSDSYEALGGPASHGCVRQHGMDAEAMWNLIGEAREAGSLVNIKVYSFGANVRLADGSSGTEREGFGEQLNASLNANIACTRRGIAGFCTSSWNEW